MERDISLFTRSRSHLIKLNEELQVVDRPMSLPYLKDRMWRVVSNTNTLHKSQYHRDTQTDYDVSKKRYVVDDNSLEKGHGKMRLSDLFGKEDNLHLNTFIPTLAQIFCNVKNQLNRSVRYNVDADAHTLHQLLVENKMAASDLSDLNDICVQMLYLSNFLAGNLLEA